VFGIARAAVRVVSIAVALVVAGRATPARADNVGELIRQLGDDDSDKVRLSAALNLTKLGDPRAILPLAKALGNDADESVRGAAAVGLGKLVTGKTAAGVRTVVVKALTQASNSDPSGLVRGEANQALKGIGVTSSGTAVQPSQGGSAIYVNIGPMASKTGDAAVDARLKGLMVKVANQTMTRVASNMATTWPGGGVPTQAILQAKSTVGFYVDGTVNVVQVTQAGAKPGAKPDPTTGAKPDAKPDAKPGSSMTVSCKINMLLADYPNKSIFGLLTGSASVQASGSTNDLALAREDCVSAVVEDLIAKKIVPTICSKAGCP
jgi:hypothetical protein